MTSSPPAISSPAAIRLPAKIVRSGEIREAMSSPAASPPYMARPPSCGTGSVCTSRSRPTCIAPVATATRRTSGVSR